MYIRKLYYLKKVNIYFCVKEGRLYSSLIALEREQKLYLSKHRFNPFQKYGQAAFSPGANPLKVTF